MGRNVALNKYLGFGWIEASSQVQRSNIICSLVQLDRIMWSRHRVEVNDKKVILVLILIHNPLPDCPEIIT